MVQERVWIRLRKVIETTVRIVGSTPSNPESTTSLLTGVLHRTRKENRLQ